jgi:hypothetical protein
MTKKHRRPARFRAGHMKDHRAELLERTDLSRTRLAASELGASGQAWKLWNACVAAMVDNAKAADQTYAGVLAQAAGINRTDAGRLLHRFDELEIFGWRAAPRASKGISELSLPDVAPEIARRSLDVAPQLARGSLDVAPQLAPPSYESLSSEVMSHDPPLDTPRSTPSLSALRGNAVEGSEAGKPPKKDTGLGALSVEELRRLAWREPETLDEVRAELARREPFAPFHGDERTGDTIGDDEAAQLRYQGANPSKTRARRPRD